MPRCQAFCGIRTAVESITSSGKRGNILKDDAHGTLVIRRLRFNQIWALECESNSKLSIIYLGMTQWLCLWLNPPYVPSQRRRREWGLRRSHSGENTSCSAVGALESVGHAQNDPSALIFFPTHLYFTSPAVEVQPWTVNLSGLKGTTWELSQSRKKIRWRWRGGWTDTPMLKTETQKR